MPISKFARWKAPKKSVLDLSQLEQIPDVPQTSLPRYEPPRGQPASLTGVVDDPANLARMRGMAEQGAQQGGLAWYNLDPLRQAFIDELGPELGAERFNRYADMVAATSPRSSVAQNIKRSSLFYGREAEGLPLVTAQSDLPKGYGHLAHNTQMKLMGALEGGGEFDPVTQPKVASFAQNLMGNQAPMTIDTHNLALMDPDMRFRTKAGEKRSPSKTEYPYLEQVQAQLAEELGMSPAQFQASAWVGGSDITGVRDPRPFLQLFDESVQKTAQEVGQSGSDTLRSFIRGEQNLMGQSGLAPGLTAAAGAGALAMAPQEAEAGTLTMARDMDRMAERIALQRERTPEERDAFEADFEAARARGDLDYIKDLGPIDLGRHIDELIDRLGQPEQIFRDEPVSTANTRKARRMNRRAGAAQGTQASLVGAGEAALAMGTGVAAGLAEDVLGLAPLLNPFRSDEEAIAYSQAAEGAIPSYMPRTEAGMEAVGALAGEFDVLGEDIERGFGRESPLYRNVAPYRYLYDRVPELYEELPERAQLTLERIGGLL